MPSIYDNENFKLDDRSKEIAREMGEDPAQKLSQIAVLRSWIMSHQFMECRTDDLFLLKFLRVAKFSLEAAKERITNWCIMSVIYLMPKPDDLGRLVLVVELRRVKDMKLSPVDFCRALYLVCEWIIFNFERAQIHGTVLIETADDAPFDMELMAYWTPERLKKSIKFLQGAFPMRMKGLEYYDIPVVLKTLLELAIGFMKPKMAKRVKLHSDKKPAENIPRECMPRCLNGAGPEWDDIKDDLLRALEDFQSEFDTFKQCKVDDAKMPKHYEEGDSWGISGSYRQIAE